MPSQSNTWFPSVLSSPAGSSSALLYAFALSSQNAMESIPWKSDSFREILIFISSSTEPVWDSNMISSKGISWIDSIKLDNSGGLSSGIL